MNAETWVPPFLTSSTVRLGSVFKPCFIRGFTEILRW